MILERLGIAFEAMVPDVAEETEGDPERLVAQNALRKAVAGASAATAADAEAGVVALGVDTAVALDGRIHPKPPDLAAARRTLETLSGTTHTVLSGLAIVTRGGDQPDQRTGVARTEVTFHPLDERTIGLYLDSGEWRERAGGYAIQGLGSILVERIEGDFSNVVGLPVPLLLELAPELFDQAADPAWRARCRSH